MERPARNESSRARRRARGVAQRQRITGDWHGQRHPFFSELLSLEVAPLGLQEGGDGLGIEARRSIPLHLPDGSRALSELGTQVNKE